MRKHKTGAPTADYGSLALDILLHPIPTDS